MTKQERWIQYSRMWREKCLTERLCIRCHKPIEPGRTVQQCKACGEKDRMRYQSRDTTKCCACRKQLPEQWGLTYCEECLEKRRVKMGRAESTEEEKAVRVELAMRRYKELMAEKLELMKDVIAAEREQLERERCLICPMGRIIEGGEHKLVFCMSAMGTCLHDELGIK